MLAAIQAKELRPAYLLEANFATGPVYLWTGTGTLAWNSQNWLGIGNLGSVSPIEEGGDVMARGLTLGLSVFNSTFLPAVMNEFKTGLPVILYFALFTVANVLIPDPFTAFSGRMDKPTIEVGGATASLSINCENRLIDLKIAPDRRWTPQDQKIDFPADGFFDFVYSIQDKTIYFGVTANKNNTV